MRGQASILILVVSVLSLAFAPPEAATGLMIIPQYGASITNNADVSASESAEIQTTINGVIALFNSHFSNNITVRIQFENDKSVQGAQSSTSISTVPYSQFRTKLEASRHSVLDHLSFMNSVPNQTNNPVNHRTDVLLSIPNLRALGLRPAHEAVFDSTITINNTISNLSRTGAYDPQKYDLAADVAHEINEVLGLGSGLDPATPISLAAMPQDLFRYKGNGVPSFSRSDPSAYLSFNGGAMPWVYFNQGIQCAPTSDYGDWFSAPDPLPSSPLSGFLQTEATQDACASKGTRPHLVDVVAWQNLDVQGYTLIPEPSTALMLAAGFAYLGTRRRRIH